MNLVLFKFTLSPRYYVVLPFNKRQKFLTFDRLTAGMANIDLTGLAAEEILKRVVDIGHRWAEGQPIYDDITLVVVRVK